jgi:hypothetical protein
MSHDVTMDPFGPRHAHEPHEQARMSAAPVETEIAWFDAPPRSQRMRSSSAPPRSLSKTPPPLPIDDPLADRWFR